MVDLVSPGVAVREIDLTTTVRNEPTSIGGVAILAQKGPIDEVVTIESEEQLALLKQLNVRYAQGFFFSQPKAQAH